MFGDRVLLLVPHPDDELVGAAAAITRQKNAGGEVFAAYLTTGVPANVGVWWGAKNKYGPRVTERWQEASSVAKQLGIETIGPQPIPSRELKSHLESTLRWVRQQSIRVGADQIWVPAYEGGHQDHDVANFLGSRLRDIADVWEFSEYHFAGGKVHGQSFIESRGTEMILRLSAEERAQKRSFLRCYASEQRNLGYVGLDREVFRPLSSYDYRHRPHPGKCFYERFHWVPIHPRIDYCRPEEVCEVFSEAG